MKKAQTSMLRMHTWREPAIQRAKRSDAEEGHWGQVERYKERWRRGTQGQREGDEHKLQGDSIIAGMEAEKHMTKQMTTKPSMLIET